MNWKDETHEKLVEIEDRLERLEELIDKIWRVMTEYGLNEDPFEDERSS